MAAPGVTESNFAPAVIRDTGELGEAVSLDVWAEVPCSVPLGGIGADSSSTSCIQHTSSFATYVPFKDCQELTWKFHLTPPAPSIFISLQGTDFMRCRHVSA